VIVAIMQPYFFPYIGYFQLMHAADTFVVLDDVQYIERGWANRNRINQNGNPSWLTLPVRNASRELAFNQREYAIDRGVPERLHNKLKQSYFTRHSYEEVSALFSMAMRFGSANVALFNTNALRSVLNALGIRCNFVMASQIDPEKNLKGQARIIHLCTTLNAARYINPIGGTSLYSNAVFESSGIQLSFLKTSAAPVQLDVGPQYLSILDTLFTQGVDGARAALPSYELIDASQCAATGSEAL